MCKICLMIFWRKLVIGVCLMVPRKLLNVSEMYVCMVGALASLLEALTGDTTWLGLEGGGCLGLVVVPFDCSMFPGILDGKLGGITPSEMRSRRPTSRRPLIEVEMMTLVLIRCPSKVIVMMPDPVVDMAEWFAAFILTFVGSSSMAMALAMSSPTMVVRHPESGQALTLWGFAFLPDPLAFTSMLSRESPDPDL